MGWTGSPKVQIELLSQKDFFKKAALSLNRTFVLLFEN